jgi:acyl-coenzyme A thioesterase PaaI-like protein
VSTPPPPGAEALQDRYAPHNRCFGCGPSNEKGLRIKSRVEVREGETIVVARWAPEAHHEAFPGVMNGGIIGALLDCHMNWTALWSLMRRDNLPKPPLTVTADYAIKLTRPTPVDKPLLLRATAVELIENRAVIEGSLEANGKICATARGTFVAVPPNHPAHKHWDP